MPLDLKGGVREKVWRWVNRHCASDEGNRLAIIGPCGKDHRLPAPVIRAAILQMAHDCVLIPKPGLLVAYLRKVLAK